MVAGLARVRASSDRYAFTAEGSLGACTESTLTRWVRTASTAIFTPTTSSTTAATTRKSPATDSATSATARPPTTATTAYSPSALATPSAAHADTRTERCAASVTRYTPTAPIGIA